MATAQAPIEQKVYRSIKQNITDADAALIGPILDDLGGKGARPSDIVEAAAAEDSPLHKFFTWNKDKAAYQHNLWEARQLAKSYAVEVHVVNNGQTMRWMVPGLVSVRTETDSPQNDRMYLTIGRVMDDAELMDRVLADAHRWLMTFRSRFETYSQLSAFERYAPVFEAIRLVTDEDETA